MQICAKLVHIEDFWHLLQMNQKKDCLCEVQGRRILLLDKNHWQAPGNYSLRVFYMRSPAT